MISITQLVEICGAGPYNKMRISNIRKKYRSKSGCYIERTKVIGNRHVWEFLRLNKAKNNQD